MLLLSTFVNNRVDFGEVLNIAEKYPRVGLEIFPFWERPGYDDMLEKYKERLLKLPISVHEQYYESEHSVDENNEKYAFTMEVTKKAIDLTQELGGKYLVYHYNNMEVLPHKRREMLENARKNLFKINGMAKEVGVEVLIENVGVLSRNNTILNEQEFIEECLNMPNNVLIDIGHAWCNGWNLERVISALKNKIVSYHIHNNNGRDDQHNRMHDGTLDFDGFVELYRKYTPNAEIVLEYYLPERENLDEIEEDIQELLKKGL